MAMVMSSRFMLLQQKVVPLSGRLIHPFSPKISHSFVVPAILRFHRCSCEPNSVTLGRSTEGVGSDRGFANPAWRKRIGRGAHISGREVLGATASSSTMAGPCSDPPPMYRLNVGICLINDKNEVFVASRLDIPGAWQMPQGGIDEGENPQAAAVRELREETGVTCAEYLGEVPDWLTYNFPPDVKAKLTTLWGTEWNGQAQKWFLFRFTGSESEINLLGDGSEKPEFSDWKWVPVEEVVNNAVEFKKAVYEQAFKHLVTLMK